MVLPHIHSVNQLVPTLCVCVCVHSHPVGCVSPQKGLTHPSRGDGAHTDFSAENCCLEDVTYQQENQMEQKCQEGGLED